MTGKISDGYAVYCLITHGEALTERRFPVSEDFKEHKERKEEQAEDVEAHQLERQQEEPDVEGHVFEKAEQLEQNE